jgi:hypothetical protein
MVSLWVSEACDILWIWIYLCFFGDILYLDWDLG